MASKVANDHFSKQWIEERLTRLNDLIVHQNDFLVEGSTSKPSRKKHHQRLKEKADLEQRLSQGHYGPGIRRVPAPIASYGTMSDTNAVRNEYLQHSASSRQHVEHAPTPTALAAQPPSLNESNSGHHKRSQKSSSPHAMQAQRLQFNTNETDGRSNIATSTKAIQPPTARFTEGRNTMRNVSSAALDTAHRSGNVIMHDAQPITTQSADKPTRYREKISPPSAESGGIPNPSPLYQLRSSLPSHNAGQLQPVLVVIDLNGTILHRPSRAQPSKFIERPFTAHFLHYVLCNFVVVVWSSAKPENVHKMCDSLFTNQQRAMLVAVMARDSMGLSQYDYVKRVQCYKRLQRVWDMPAVQNAHPFARHGRTFDQTNTILIDDSLEKARSEPYNLVRIPEFIGQSEDPNILRKVAEYLDILKTQTNISSYIRNDPFQLENVQIIDNEKDV